MRVPVVSSQQSWRRKKARTLRRIRETVQQSLHFLTLWGRTLQKIGGKYAFEKKKKNHYCQRKLLILQHLMTVLSVFFFASLVIGCFFYPTGNFGGGVQSFFLFLRFLVLLNLVTSLLIAAFVLVPSIIFNSSSSSASASASTSASVPVNSFLNASGIGFHSQTLCFSDSSGCFFNVNVSRSVERKVTQGRRSRCDAAVSRQQSAPHSSADAALSLQLHQPRCSPQT